MAAERNWVPAGIDTSVPSPARVYDYWLGGGHNFEADRILAEQILKIMPDLRSATQLNRSFLRRAVLHMVDNGVRQFLDIGSGIPTVGNLHEIVQRADPSCRVVYVDRDPVAVAHSQMLLAGNPNAAVIQTDLRDVEGVLEAPETRELIDFDQPVGLIMLLLLHFVPDEWDPVGLISQYRERLAPGSFFAVSHVSGDANATGLNEAVEAYKRTQNAPIVRSHDEVLRFFEGFELEEPGLVGCAFWRPDGVGDVTDKQEINNLPFAGVARKV
ncbi:SAM-dependent methyltransferase [Crossiella sp. CA198]|uniref:SAM-dependent methyltransferase n=1 Tax=Crossiella sp. CA198 TaxID=3455607 RepID=UPI003F8D226C